MRWASRRKLRLATTGRWWRCYGDGSSDGAGGGGQTGGREAAEALQRVVKTLKQKVVAQKWQAASVMKERRKSEAGEDAPMRWRRAWRRPWLRGVDADTEAPAAHAAPVAPAATAPFVEVKEWWRTPPPTPAAGWMGPSDAQDFRGDAAAASGAAAAAPALAAAEEEVEAEAAAAAIDAEASLKIEADALAAEQRAAARWRSSTSCAC